MLMKPLFHFFLFLLLSSVLPLQTNLVFCQSTLPLSGPWRFQLDRNDEGLRARWFEKTLPDRVSLPGTLSAQGIGDEISLETKWTGEIVDRSFFTDPEYAPYRQTGNIKVPFWLQPDRYYAGAAWYQRDIVIPPNWKGKRVVLWLERPHWETRLWVDGRPMGSNNALAVPHQYDLGAALVPGIHTLTLRVDNRLIVDIGVNSHSISDHTQGNWNGIAGEIGLKATAQVWIEDMQVFPHVQSKSVTIQGRIGNLTGKAGKGTLSLLIRPDVIQQQANVAWDIQGGSFKAEIPLGSSAKTWDEFNPALYRLTTILKDSQDSRTIQFGLREIVTDWTQFVLNGRKIFIRGTLECAIFPMTGHPPTDVDSWKRIIRIAKAYGLNNIRFHSWCPPEAAFVAADEMGFYYHVECSSWANGSSSLGDGKPVDRWIYEEADRILKAYGNHPSFLLMPYGNEPGGKQHAAFLAKWVSHYKALDPRRLYTSGAGWPQIPENQFHVAPDPRIQAWGGGLKSRINAQPPETRTDYREYISARQVPVISHEIGQWCVYPNFDEISKYQGYLKPKNFEIFRDKLRAHGMLEQAGQFLLASGKLQTLCYKEDIESALRTPGMGGFQLLDLHDFPGQGTALVGVLDPFWDSKGYVTGAEYSRFCNSTVPLARLGKRIFTTDETLEADLEVAHFGPAPLPAVATTWKLTDENSKILASGILPSKLVSVNNAIPLGRIKIPLNSIPAPARCKLMVGLQGTPFENDWDIWVYPPQVSTGLPQGISVANVLDVETLQKINQGGKILLLIPPAEVSPDPKLGKIELGFSSIFWNTAWTRRQAPHTLGILCDPQHPALASFPTEFHSNWQWWYLITRAGAMRIDQMPSSLQPIVQVIDDWFTARKLGLVFEAKSGKGKLLVCSIDLQNGLGQNPVVRQMRRSLLDYMASEKFDPKTEVSLDQLRELMADHSSR
jgi:hypothetical protein